METPKSPVVPWWSFSSGSQIIRPIIPDNWNNWTICSPKKRGSRLSTIATLIGPNPFKAVTSVGELTRRLGRPEFIIVSICHRSLAVIRRSVSSLSSVIAASLRISAVRSFAAAAAPLALATSPSSAAICSSLPCFTVASNGLDIHSEPNSMATPIATSATAINFAIAIQDSQLSALTKAEDSHRALPFLESNDFLPNTSVVVTSVIV